MKEDEKSNSIVTKNGIMIDITDKDADIPKWRQQYMKAANVVVDFNNNLEYLDQLLDHGAGNEITANIFFRFGCTLLSDKNTLQYEGEIEMIADMIINVVRKLHKHKNNE